MGSRFTRTEEEIRFLWATLSVLLTMLASFYWCFFFANLGKSERSGVG